MGGYRGSIVNHDFFCSITPLTSYWAGLIAADGYIRPEKNFVRLNMADGEQVVRLAEEAKFGAMVAYQEKPGINQRTQRVLQVHSKRWIEDLKINFGITADKSTTLSFPTGLDQECENAFVCGFLDGDGSIFVNSAGILRVVFIGTNAFLHGLKGRHESGRIYPGLPVGRLDYNGSYAAKFLDSIYSPELPLLARKWSKAGFSIHNNELARIE